MTSQILAVFYLNDLDHFIKENLKIKYYIRFQDDWCLYHESKDYLKYCLEEIKKFLTKEKLTLNRKSRIYKGRDNFVFLGRDVKGKYAKYRVKNRRINKKYKLYLKKEVGLSNLLGTIVAYRNVERLPNKY